VVAVVTQTHASSYNSIYIVGYQTLELDDNSCSFLAFQLLSVIALVAITLPFAWRMNGMYWVTVGLALATVVSEYSKTLFQRRQEFSRFALVDFMRSALFFASVATAVALLRHQLRAWQPVALQAACFAFVFAVISGINLNADLLRIGKAIRLAVLIWRGKYRFLFGYFCILAMFTQLDVFMLKAISDSVQLATYGAAFRYYTLLSLALGAIQIVLLPAIQQLVSAKQLDALLAKHFKLLVVFAIGTFAAAWAAQWIIPAIDMGKYPQSVAVFRILALSAVLSFALSPHVNLVMRFEDFRFLTVLISAAMFINIALNFPLVRSRGAIGASIATLISYLFLNGSIFLRARRYRGMLAAEPQPTSEVGVGVI
jgi:O-antigen/teichoic acid export membrane protein